MHHGKILAPAAARLSVAICTSLAVVCVLGAPAGNASAGGWTSNGPIRTWGGAAFAVASSSPNVVYAPASDGVFVSTNHGHTWASAGRPFGGGGVVAVAPSNADVVYAGGETNVWRSTSGGKRWTVTAFPSRVVPWYQHIVVDPSDPDTVYVQEYQGVWKSTDGGDSFKHVLTVHSIGAFSLAIDPANGNDLYVGARLANTHGQAVVYSTTDAGTTWTYSGAGLPTQDVVSLAVADWSPTTVYAATEAGVFASSDGGHTWAAAGGGLPADGASEVVVDPTHQGTLYATSASSQQVDVYKSLDGGASWALEAPGVTSLAIDPVQTRRLYGSSGISGFSAGFSPVLRSTDGGKTWAPSSAGFVDTNALALATVPSAPGTVYESNGYFVGAKSTDDGVTWTPFFPPTGGYCSLAVAPSDADVVYMSSGRSTDGRVTWSPMNTSWGYSACVLAVDPRDPEHVFAAIRHAVFESTDGGDTWHELAGSEISGNSDPSFIVVDPSRPDTIYVGQTFLDPGHSGGVQKTTDGGTTWSFVDTGLPSDLDPSGLAIDPSNPDTLYLSISEASYGHSRGVFKSTNGGLTWSTSNEGMTNKDVRAIAVNPDSASTVYAGTFGRGVFRSTDGGESWHPWNRRLTDLAVESLAVDPNGTFVHAGTQSRGVFDRPA